MEMHKLMNIEGQRSLLKAELKHKDAFAAVFSSRGGIIINLHLVLKMLTAQHYYSYIKQELLDLPCMCNSYFFVPYSAIPCSGFYRITLAICFYMVPGVRIAMQLNPPPPPPPPLKRTF